MEILYKIREVELAIKIENLKVESLDDLFDEPTLEKVENKKQETIQELKIEPQKEKQAPTLPQTQEEDDDELDIDLQKELEAKFDELFGPIEDND